MSDKHTHHGQHDEAQKKQEEQKQDESQDQDSTGGAQNPNTSSDDPIPHP